MKSAIKCLTLIITLTTIPASSAQNRIAVEDIPAPGEFQFSGEMIVLPLSDSGSHPMISVDFGDGEAYRFIVDTGASVNVLDGEIADKLGFNVIGEMEIGAPGGNQVPGNIVEAPDFGIGEGRVNNAEFVTMNISALTGGMSQGVIGMALFRNYLLTYDLSQHEIRVEKRNLSVGDPGVISYSNISGKIQIQLDVAGTLVDSHVDTGSMGGFMLPEELMKSLPLKSPPQEGAPARMVGGDRKTWNARLDGSIRFAGHVFIDPKINFISPSTGFGNVGGAIYGQYVMSIDQSSQLIHFSGREEPARRTAAPARRILGLAFRGLGNDPQLAVASVSPGSLSESAGFEVGDKLVSVNGVPASEYSMPELGKLFGSSEALRFVIDRDGEILSIEIE